MTAKDKFTPEEWKTLLQAPILVGFAVVAASPSGPVGFVKEMSAVAGSLIDGEQSAAPDSLLGAVISEIKADPRALIAEPHERPSIAEAKTKTLENIHQVVQLLAAKAGPEEADAYKRWLLSVGHKVAEAGKEGGFLGFGGVQVSENETAVLNEIAGALGA